MNSPLASVVFAKLNIVLFLINKFIKLKYNCRITLSKLKLSGPLYLWCWKVSYQFPHPRFQFYGWDPTSLWPGNDFIIYHFQQTNLMQFLLNVHVGIFALVESFVQSHLHNLFKEPRTAIMFQSSGWLLLCLLQNQLYTRVLLTVAGGDNEYLFHCCVHVFTYF